MLHTRLCELLEIEVPVRLARPGVEVVAQPEFGRCLLLHGFGWKIWHPQIVLTDLVMPHLSGIEVLERIMEFDPSTEVILMTAHYSSESAVEAIKKGASDYLGSVANANSLAHSPLG